MSSAGTRGPAASTARGVIMAKSEFEVCSRVERPDPRLGELGRRDFLYRFGRGVGSLALSSLLCRDGWLQAAETAQDPLAPKQPHFAAKAKACIFLFMEGGSGPDGHLRSQTGVGQVPWDPGHPRLRQPGEADLRGQPLQVRQTRAVRHGSIGDLSPPGHPVWTTSRWSARSTPTRRPIPGPAS